MAADSQLLHRDALAAAARGDRDAALRLLGEAARLAPGDADIAYNLGVLRREGGDLAGAVGDWRRALAHDPGRRDAALNLARGLEELGDAAAARAQFAALAASRPEDRDALAAFANFLQRQGDFIAALPVYQSLIAAHPDYAAGWVNLGQLARRLGNRDVARTCFARALDLQPGYLPARAGLAAALADAGQIAAARATWDAAAAQAPDDRDVQFNRADFLTRHGQPGEAEAAYEGLAARHPDFAAAWVNLGMARKRAGAFDQAEAAYRRAIALAPGDALAHFDLAHLLLARGRWDDGLAEYEWRARLPGAVPPPPGLPAFTGREPTETRVLVWSDQGFGDTIQFLRYVPLLAARGWRCTVLVAAPLRRLTAAMAGVASVAAMDEPPPEADCQVALSSLPLRLGLKGIGAGTSAPYLAAPAIADPELAGMVGLAWAGDPRHPNDAQRSARLDRLAPLLDAPGLRFASLLPPGPGRDELLASRWAGRIADLGAGFADFADAAAAIAALAAVVSVDTAAAHLAGALGRPGFVLLPAFECDWRWGFEGESTPWYPSLRLVRQERAGDWETVAARVAALLPRTPPGP